jgi:diguanylate cyclase
MEETHSLAMTDGLTGLANRRHAAEFLQRELARTGRHGAETSIALCDVDHFKRINDTLGHNVGDVVLRWVAESLVGGVRTTDLVSRWGGEEFLVVLPDSGPAIARVVAERLRGRIEKGRMSDETVGTVTMSVGVACTEGPIDPDALIARADAALYRAKNSGRNRVVFGE